MQRSSLPTSSRKCHQVNVTSVPSTLSRHRKLTGKTFQSHRGPTKGALISQNVALLTWENANRDTTPCAKGFGVGGAFIFSSRRPLYLYKAKLTSMKKGLLKLRSSAPRGVHTKARAGSSRATAGEFSPARRRERGSRPRSAPPRQAPAGEPSWALGDAPSAAVTRPLPGSERRGARSVPRRAPRPARPPDPRGRGAPRRPHRAAAA